MPYLHLDLPGTYPVEVKRELATRLCMLYALVMETQRWRPNVGIAELGRDNLYHLGADGLEPVTMVLVEFRRGRTAEQRLALGRAGDEMLRDGNWVQTGHPRKGPRHERFERRCPHHRRNIRLEPFDQPAPKGAQLI